MADIFDQLTNISSKLDGIQGSIKAGVTALGKGNLTGRSLVEGATGITENIPGLGLMSKAVKNVADIGFGAAENLQKASQHGFYAGENLGKFGSSVLGTRDSLDHWQNRLDKSATSMASLGSTMDTAMFRYNSMAKSLQENPLAMQLEQTGIRAEELNDILAMSVAQRKFVDFSDEQTKKSAINSAIALASEMDKMARFTGMSRQEQEKALNKELEKKEVQLSLLAMNEKEAESFTQTMAGLGDQSQLVKDVFTEMATGGIRTEEGSKKVAALSMIDDRLPGLMTQISELSKSERPEDQARVKELTNQFKEAMSALSPEKARQLAMLSKTELGGMAAEGVLDSKALGPTRQMQLEAFERASKGEAVTTADIRKEKEAGIARERAGVTAEGKPDAGSALYRGIESADRLAKDVSALAGEKGFEKLNQKTGELILSFGKLGENLRPMTTEELGNKLGVDKAMKALGWGSTGETSKAAPTEAPKGQWSNLPSRQEGTAKATGGSLVEDWQVESLAKLHGKEGVIPQAQLEKMYGNVADAMKQVSTSTNASLMPSKMSDSATAKTDFSTIGTQLSSQLEKLGATQGTQIKDLGKVLSDQISKLGESVKQPAKSPAETKPTEPKPVETKPTETKPVETKPVEAITPQSVIDDITKIGKLSTPKEEKEEPKKEKGFFDQISDAFYEVGNIAGKGYDELTKKSSNELGGNVKYEVTKNGLTEEERAARLKAENTPEKVAARKANYAAGDFSDDDENFGNKLSSSLKDLGVTGLGGAGADALSSMPDEIKSVFSESGFNNISETLSSAQSDLISSVSSEKELETAKSDELMQAIERVVAAQPQSNAVKAAESAGNAQESPMSDLKSELVMLNTHMRELISHTHDVASTSKQQVRVTQQAATGSLI